MLKEFKAFIMRGNVLDLAVAVVIGAAFGTIVNSLVKDVLMPPLGLIIGQINFSDLFINFSGKSYESLKAAQDAGAPTINYGLFIQTVINFIIVAFVIFMIVRLANKLQGPKTATVTTKECPYCFTNISLKATRCPNCTSEMLLPEKNI